MRSMLRSGVSLLAAVGLFAAVAQPAAANTYIYGTGGYEVCAASLTHHLAAGGTVTLSRGHNYNVVGFGDGYNHVWGYNQGGRYGWVYNGWFCP